MEMTIYTADCSGNEKNSLYPNVCQINSEDALKSAVSQDHDRERIEERLRKLGIDYGCLDKDESIRRWNRGGMPVALIHPASAGHGLNLQSGGSTIVWFSLT